MRPFQRWSDIILFQQSLTFIRGYVVDFHANLIDELQHRIHRLVQYFHQQQRELLSAKRGTNETET